MDTISGTTARRPRNSPLPIVQQLALEVVGVLGQTKLTMGDLSNLKIGDLVLLEQKIDQPIILTIDDETHFHCWPGRLGNRQGIEIAEIL